MKDLDYAKQERDLEPRLTMKYVASLLGISYSSVRRLEKSGKLVPRLYTAGGHRRYALRDVLDFAMSLKQRKENENNE